MSNHCLLNLKARREDQRNTVPAASFLEMESDTESGGKGKGDLRIKACREVFSFLYSGEGSLGKILAQSGFLSAGMVVVRMRPYGRR